MNGPDTPEDQGATVAAGSALTPDACDAAAAITIPEFGSFAEIDELRQLTIEVEAHAEVARFGPTTEDAHPMILHEALDRLRSFCLLLPETTEVNPFGHPTFRVATKAYATFELVGARPSVLFKTEPEDQIVLVARDEFERDPDTGHHGWTLAWVTAELHWDQLDELIIASYRLVAPPELVAQLDALLG